MVRGFGLLVVVAIAAGHLYAGATASHCGTLCASADPGGVTLTDSSTTRVAPGDRANTDGGSAGDLEGLLSCVTKTPPNTQLFRDCNGAVDGVGDLGGVPAQPGAPGRAVTIEDVARFLPADAVLHTEPAGWAVVRVPANFWVAVQPVTVQAPLLGRVAEVRFTPVAYRWSYGDGTVRTTGTPGASWAALGQQELTPTATSHLYLARAHVQAQVGVVYTAAYRVGGGPFLPIAGAVAGEAPPVPTLVVAEHTVLTNGSDGG